MKPDLETPAYQADISSSKPNNYIFPMPCFEIYIHEHEKKKTRKEKWQYFHEGAERNCGS